MISERKINKASIDFDTEDVEVGDAAGIKVYMPEQDMELSES